MCEATRGRAVERGRLSDEAIVEQATRSNSPMIVATDGRHIDGSDGRPRRTAACIVICESHLDERDEGGEWLHRQAKPILVQVSMLPAKTGVDETDNIAAEPHALNV